MNPWSTNNVTGSAAGHADGNTNNGIFSPANPDQNTGTGAATIDPSVTFLNPSALPQHNLTPAQQAQAHQRMFNGAAVGPGGQNARNMTPGFHTPSSVVPSKRPRPEDNMAMPGGMNLSGMHGGMPPNMGMMMSPRPPNMGSPSVPYPGAGNAGGQHGQLPGGMNGASPFSNQGLQIAGTSEASHPPTPFAHLQHTGSGTASPNPLTGSGDFDSSNIQGLSGIPGAAGSHQRVPSASPFSPANLATLGAQMQGVPATTGANLAATDHPSRAGTPHNPSFPQGVPFQPGQPPLGISPGMQASQYIPGVGGAAGAGFPGGFNAAALQNLTPQQRQQRLYQMQLANQTKQMHNAAQSISGGMPPGGIGMQPRAQNAAAAAAAMGMPMGMNPNMNAPGGGQTNQGNMPPGGMVNMPGNAGGMGMNPNMNINAGGPAGPLPSQVPPGMNPQQLAAMRQASTPNPSMPPQQNNSPEAFVRMLQRFMASRGQPFDPAPTVCGRPIALLHLWSTVMRMGGSKKVTAMNAWAVTANHIGLNPAQFQTAPSELRDVFLRNLAAYEAAFIGRQKMADGQDLRQQATQVQLVQQQQYEHAVQTQKRQQMLQQQRQQQTQQQQRAQAQAQQQHQQQQGQQGPQGQPSNQPSFSPPPPVSSQQQQQNVATSSVGQSPAPMPTTTAPEVPSINSPYNTQAQSQNTPNQPQQGKRGSSLSRPLTGAAPSPANGRQQQSKNPQSNLLQPSQPANTRPSPSRTDPSNRNQAPVSMPPHSRSPSALPQHPTEVHQPYSTFRKPLPDRFRPSVLPEATTHGPVHVDEVYALGEEIARLKPTVPRFMELGIIDIHALTMGVRSGIHAEMRHALDTLATVTSEPNVHLTLENCPELVEALVECGEDQADLLAENAAEIEVSSDAMAIAPYEEVLSACHAETISLRDYSEFGTLDYDLDKSVDRLICVTSILRNLSFSEHNFKILSAPFVIKFIAGIIQVMGTRNMLLRTHQNTLDLMKDLIVFLSNIAHVVELPGREEAVCLLVFLLAFAPTGVDEDSSAAEDEKTGDAEECENHNSSSMGETTATEGQPGLSVDKLSFPSYEPAIHRYLPLAVDALAKLLARDDPNRTLFKALFAQDSAAFSASIAHQAQAGQVPPDRTSQPADLLSRTFALAICPLPSPLQTSTISFGQLLTLIEVRKPLLMQSLLAADVLTGMLAAVAGGSGAPADVSRMARAWLGRVDGWVSALGRMVAVLLDTIEKSGAAMANASKQSGRGPTSAMQPSQYGASNMYSNQQQGSVDEAISSILKRGLSILRRLAEYTETSATSRPAAANESTQASNMDETSQLEDAEPTDEVSDAILDDASVTAPSAPSKAVATSSTSGRYSLPPSVFLRKERVLAALMAAHVDTETLKHICDFSKLGVV